jgi:deferrochelatase/peroxidase EfeB
MTSAQYLRDQPTQTEGPPPPANTGRTSVSRRGLLGAAGAGLVGLAAGAAGGYGLGAEKPGTRTYPFYGEHQAGILTPVQDRLHFAAFDVITDSRAELVQLLKEWTVATARMTQGLGAGEIGPTSGPYGAPRTTLARPSACPRQG